MGIELSEDDKKGMSPAEIEALTNEDTEANLRAHGAEAETAAQLMLDEAAAATAKAEGTVEVEGEGETTTAKPAAEVEGEGADTPTAEELAALLEDGDDTPAPVAPKPFKVETRDFKAEIEALDTKIQDIDDKWSAGEMTDAERKEALKPLRTEHNALLREEIKAETLREVNTQNEANIQALTADQINAACKALIVTAKAAKTIDYDTDPTAAEEFDGFLRAHEKRHAGKSAQFIVNEAHKSMLAYRGIAVAKAAAPPPPAPARRDVPSATLSGLPAASPVGMENAVLDKLNGLQGDDYEEAFAALPQAEQDRILRAADQGAMKFTKGTKRGAKSRSEAESVE